MTPAPSPAPSPAPVPDDAPLAVATRRRWPQPIWGVPLAALAIVLWLAFGVLQQQGPTVRISFRSAEGLEPGKTRIKYRELDVGTVRSVALAPGEQSVVVTAEMSRDAAPFLRNDTRFWVVKPRFAGGQVSGIGTLLSGSYIGMAAGTAEGSAREFKGLESPPIVTGGVPGRPFVLKARQIGSLNVGSPVYLRQLQVGQLVAYELDPDGGGLTLTIFVEAPYDRHVTPDTRFWNASGVDLSLDASGVRVRTESLASLLIGGIAFETPDTPMASAAASAAPVASAPAAAGTAPAAPSAFTLWSTRSEALRDRDAVVERYVLVFDQSVRGLAVGAPVDFRGVPVGEVTHIGIEFDAALGRYRMPVEVSLYPQRLAARERGPGSGKGHGAIDRSQLARLVERGLRAQLRTGNLLTGQLYVALDFFPGGSARLDTVARPPRIPTVPGSFEELQTALATVVKNLEKVPFDQVAADLRQALASLDRTLRTVDATVARLDGRVTPELERTLAQARETLASAERAIAQVGNAAQSAQGSLGPDAAWQAELRSTLRDVSRAADQLRQLADLLNRHPQALLRGKPETPP